MTTNFAEAAEADGEPLVDFEQLLAAAGDDAQILNELISLYFEQATSVMAQMVTAVQQRSAKDVDYLAHKLVGASLACGMSSMVAPLRELEHGARKGNLDQAEELQSLVASRLEKLRKVIGEFSVKYKNGQAAA
jgi:HPt (histidine-containing phosphotransfer) domain-containing protein